jgi:hypothetical protein
LPFAAASVFRGVPVASAACALPPIASVAMAAKVAAVAAPAVNIRRRDAPPGDLAALSVGRDCHIFMTLLVIESYRKICDN